LGIGARATPAQVDQSMGRAIQNAGQAVGQYADQQQRLALKLQQEQLQTQEDRGALEAANALSKGEAYWHEQTTTRSQSWKPGDPDLREAAGKDYDKWLNDTAAALPTERSRMYFQTQAGSMRSRMDRGLFDFQERRTTDTIIQSSEEGMSADLETIYRDPARRAEVTARRLAAIEVQTRIPPDKRLEIGRKYIDQANLAAESSEMERDPAGYIARRFGKAAGAPSGAAPSAAGAAPEFDGLFAAVVHQESRGKHTGESGGLLTSPKGARGITQVMPKTGVDPGYGVKPLQNETQEEYVRFGRDYLSAMLREFDGDTPKALAAYNAGPGRVKALIKKHGEDWLKKAPAETREYVEKIGGRVGLGQQQTPAGGAAAEVGGVIELPDAPESFRALPYQEREKLRADAEGRMRQQTAVMAQSSQNRLKDAEAMARDGIVDPKPLTADAFAAMGDKGPEAFAEYQRSQTMAADIAGMKLASNADLAAVASGSLRRAVPGAGYEAEDTRDQIRAQAAAQVLKQREADPAGYVSKAVPSVVKAAQAAFAPNLSPEQRAAATQRLATETVAAQRTLGVAEPRVLTAAAIEDLTRRISKARKPEDASDLVISMEAEFGKDARGGYFGTVMKELMQAGKLPPALMIIPNLDSYASRELVSALSVIKMEDLKTGLDGDQQRQAREGAVAGVAELALSIPQITGSSAALLSSYQDMIERIALRRMQQVMDTNGVDAAENATKTLLGKYQFVDGMRLPAGVNAGQIQNAGVDRVQRVVLPALTADDVPGYNPGVYRAEDALLQWRNLISKNAVWRTAADDKTLQLWARGEDEVLYQVKQGGKPVQFTFDDLTAPTKGSPTFARADTAGRIQSNQVTSQDLDAALQSGNMRLYDRLQAQQKAERRALERQPIRRD
jgi:hypothetical protein